MIDVTAPAVTACVLDSLASPVGPPLLDEPPPATDPVGQDIEVDDAHPEQTAGIGVGAVNMALIGIWGMPLDDDERIALTRDLGAVLAKHNVPDLPYQEELSLAMTTTGIVLRRITAKKVAETNDSSVDRQEGVGQVNGAQASSVQAAPRLSAVGSFLAR